MKRYKAKYGNRYCTFGDCIGRKTKAVYLESGIGPRSYACEEHKAALLASEDDGYMSEADHQTWGRL